MEALRLAAHGLPVVVVNPAHVFGAGDRHRSSTELVRRFLRGQIPAYVDGALNIVDAEDVARGHLLADERGEVGERYILGNRNFTLDRLFADLARLSGVEPPALKLPLPAALALARAAELAPGRPAVTTVEVRASSLWWAFRSTKAKRELGWRPAHHEDTLQTTIDWYREREPARLKAPGARQPLALRAAGLGLRTAGGMLRSFAPSGRATLHRCRTPTDWLCPCGRVARELRRRGVDYEEVRVAWRQRDRPEIEKLSGQRHVPLLVIEKRRDLRLAADHRAPGVAPVSALVSSASALSLAPRKTGSKAKSTARPAPTRSSRIAGRPAGEPSVQPLSDARRRRPRRARRRRAGRRCRPPRCRPTATAAPGIQIAARRAGRPSPA